MSEEKDKEGVVRVSRDGQKEPAGLSPKVPANGWEIGWWWPTRYVEEGRETFLSLVPRRYL